MAKGAVAKQTVFETILKTFEGSFMYNNGKECRIPIEENGDILQIKVTLTAAKDIVDASEGSTSAAPASFPAPKKASVDNGTPAQAPVKMVEPTEEEKQNIESLMAALGLN